MRFKRPIIAIAVGLCFTYVLYFFLPPIPKFGNTFNFDFNKLDSSQLLSNIDREIRKLSERLTSMVLNVSESNYTKGEDILAKLLFHKVRVFCLIITMPNNHETKAIHVKATWAKHCNKYLFFSSKEDPNLPSIGLPVEEGRDKLWSKTREAFKYAHRHFIDDYDFFLKTDDDTYAVIENLRFMLKTVNPEDAVFYGRRFKLHVKQGFTSGGPGYVLSRAAVKRFIKDGIGKNPHCPTGNDGGGEDVHVGFCMEALGVAIGDSRDELGRERFHPFIPRDHINIDTIKSDSWLHSYNFYPLKSGPDCCSDTTVSFHYITPHMMYELEFLIYQMHPFGIGTDYLYIVKYLHEYLVKQKEGNLNKKVIINNEKSQTKKTLVENKLAVENKSVKNTVVLLLLLLMLTLVHLVVMR